MFHLVDKLVRISKRQLTLTRSFGVGPHTTATSRLTFLSSGGHLHPGE